MPPKVLALYDTARIALLALSITAMIQSLWPLAFGLLVVRSAIWWIALPHRRTRKTGQKIGEFMASHNRETARSIGMADIALTLAKMPLIAAVPCRLMLFLPGRMMGDPTANALLLYGRRSSAALERILRFGSAEDRATAARAVAELKPDGFEGILRPLLSDSIDSVRLVAEEALGVNETTTSSDPVIRLIRLPEDEVVPSDLVVALRAIFDISLVGERRTIIKKLGKHRGDEAVGWLLEFVRSGKSEAIWAIRAVDGIDDPRVADALLERVSGASSSIALRQLALRKDVRIEPILIERLERSYHWASSGMYVSFLAELDTVSSRAEVQNRLERGRGAERIAAAEAIARHAGDSGPLRRLARTWHPWHRFLARHALERLS